MREYTYNDLVYVGGKLHFLTPGKTYQIITEYNKEGSIIAKSFTGDDGKIHIINNWGDGKDLIFVTISEWRDARLKEILK